jgi:hypothetical protein
MNSASKSKKSKHRVVEVMVNESFWELQEKTKLFGFIPIWQTIETTEYYATRNYWINEYDLKETYCRYPPPY